MKRNPTMPFARALLPVAVAVLSLPVVAEEESVKLSNVVVSAAGYEQKIVDAPASISVITSEELRTRPYVTLIDAVRELEGVDIGETRDKTGQATISMRGMGSDYTLILINGRRQNNHGNIYPNSFGGNQFNHIPPLDAIERIEVIRGPASTLYGADAMGGVINIITKGVTDEWSGSVTHSRTFQSDSNYGNDITTDFTVMGPLIPGVLGLAVRGSAYDRLESNPDYTSVFDPNGVEHNRSLGFGGGGKTVDNKNTQIGATLTWTPTANQRISFDIDSYNQKYDNSDSQLGTLDSIDTIWRAPGYCDGASGNNPNRCVNDTSAYPGVGVWKTDRIDPRVGYIDEQEFTRDTMSLTHEGTWRFGNSFVSLQQVKTNNNGRTLPFTVAEREDLLAIYQGTGAYAGMTEEAARKKLAEEKFLPRPKRTMESEQLVLDAKLDMPFELAGQHTAVVGAQVIRGELKDDVFGLETSNSGAVQEHNMWSLFAEDTWYVLTPLAITAGVRYDNHEYFGDHISPRLYAVYNLTSDWTIKGGVSTGYKTPMSTDMYDGVIGFGGQGTIPQYGNSDLKPETSTSSEVALYWQHPTSNHNFNITVFQNKFEDKIASQDCGGVTGITCTPAGDYGDLGYANSSKKVNIDEVTLQGVEVAGRLQILDTVGLRANYTYTDSEQKSGDDEGKPFGNIAKHMANATLDWQATDRFGLLLTLESRDKRYRSWDTVKDQAKYYKGYEVLHLGFNYKLSENVTLNGRVNNVLDLDFTEYDTTFESCTTGNDCIKPTPTSATGYVPTYEDAYNNKDKRRNYWLSLNVTF